MNANQLEQSTKIDLLFRDYIDFLLFFFLPLRQIWPHLETACVEKPQYISGRSGRPLSEGHFYPGEKTNKQKLKFNSSCNVSVNLAFYVLDKIHLQPLFKDILLKNSCTYLYIIKEINQNYCKLVKINCCGLNCREFKI